MMVIMKCYWIENEKKNQRKFLIFLLLIIDLLSGKMVTMCLHIY